tara:strand:+ start:1315 stop:1761 length:447 start_codon:yes stop_codon:yes gene_type:complete
MSFLKQIQNKLFLIIGIVFFSISSIFGFSVDGENFEANFKISSWTASKDGSVITSEGIVGEGYGKVYLTHTFSSNNAEGSSGDFAGQARTINKDGEMRFASLQGVWKREGTIVKMYSLDGVTNGVMNYVQGQVDLFAGTLSFDVFPID